MPKKVCIMSEKTSINANDTDATRITATPVDDETRIAPVNPSLNKPATPHPSQATEFTGDYNEVAQLSVGDILKDTYELVQVLGEGGMGTVFKALNKVWAEVEARDPYVAIKVLKPELSANKQLVRSLYSDFDRTKMLANCPNIIKVYGFDRDKAHVFMTMEFLHGKTLGDCLNRSGMRLEDTWYIIEGVGNALAYAHQHNIVHRDIKPGNIMICTDGTVKVLDFGIASKINENEGDETKFGGHELGALTVAYASPEMQRDFPPDARDDIYAYACVIYEILTGKQFYKQKINKAEHIKGLNSRQMDILNKSLAFERDQRTPNIREILEKLRPVKTPWTKYASIGGAAVLLLGLSAWGITEMLNDDVVQLNEQPKPTEVKPEIKPETKPEVKPEIKPEIKPETTAEIKPEIKPEIKTETTPEIKPEIKPETKPETTPDIKPEVTPEAKPEIFIQNGTSSDGMIQLHTSKAEYKNGENFSLSFTLAEPQYVRVLNRDARGLTQVLRPNVKQADNLLPDNQELVFPPKGVKAPVDGAIGDSSIIIISSPNPFPKNLKPKDFINPDGTITDLVKNNNYSWVQVHYTLR